jgi:polar amino acid transport system permease protein
MFMPDAAFWSETLLPALNRGVLVSLSLIIPAASLGFIGGVALGCLRAFGPCSLKRLGDGYTSLLRGVPLVVQLMMIYYALPKLGIYFEPYGAALTSFILCTAAYQSEYVRGAILSIKQGQIKAALALGFSFREAVLWIIVPQAARRALPGCGNEIIYLIKYSSLAYLVTCMELMGEGKVVASDSFRFTEVFLAVGAYYLALVTLAGFLLRYLERRFHVPGFGAP